MLYYTLFTVCYRFYTWYARAVCMCAKFVSTCMLKFSICVPNLLHIYAKVICMNVKCVVLYMYARLLLCVNMSSFLGKLT